MYLVSRQTSEVSPDLSWSLLMVICALASIPSRLTIISFGVPVEPDVLILNSRCPLNHDQQNCSGDFSKAARLPSIATAFNALIETVFPLRLSEGIRYRQSF